MSVLKERVSNLDDIIDSRDIIEELGEEIDRLEEGEYNTKPELREFAKQWQEYDHDFAHGSIAIRDSYFTKYAEDYAYDCGLVSEDATWPNYYIDWEAAARDLKDEYTGIEFDGVRYWVRG